MYKNFFDGYKALIFDLDGTVVNDELAWENSIVKIFSNEIISENPYYGERGQDIRSKIYNILKRNIFRSGLSEESYYQMVVNDFFQNIDLVEVTQGFVEFANFLKSKGKKLVLVTNSDSRITSGIIDKKGLKEYFDMVLTADDVKFPKPAPDIYQLALSKMNLKNNEVLVFEDSVSGALAAENADLKIIILLPEQHKPSDYGSKNRVFIEDFETITQDLDEDMDSYVEEIFSK